MQVWHVFGAALIQRDTCLSITNFPRKKKRRNATQAAKKVLTSIAQRGHLGRKARSLEKKKAVSENQVPKYNLSQIVWGSDCRSGKLLLSYPCLALVAIHVYNLPQGLALTSLATQILTAGLLYLCYPLKMHAQVILACWWWYGQTSGNWSTLMVICILDVGHQYCLLKTCFHPPNTF